MANQQPLMVGHDCHLGKWGARHKSFYNASLHGKDVGPQSILTKYHQDYGYITAAFVEVHQQHR